MKSTPSPRLPTTLPAARRLAGATVLLALALSLHGQQIAPVSTPPDTSSRSNAATDPAIIELSPFEVTAGSDQGYAARETLAGTRFKSELKDVPSQVSVMTKEFLEDIASVSVEDAFRYSINVENTAEFTSATNASADFNQGVLNTRSANRIRGLNAPGVTHDFFRTYVLQDTYNTERVSYSSGPNAILFGNGNPGGIVDTSFLRANLQRPGYEVSFRTDNHGSMRGSVDLNQPLIKDTLGLRFAAVKGHQESWRKPAGRDDDRYYGTFTLKPLPSTTLRAYYEDAMLDMTTPRNTRFGDQVTPWIKAGRPAFNNGLTDPTVIDATNNGIFARNNSGRPVFIVGAAAPDSPYTIWGSSLSVSITLPRTRYSSWTIGPGDTPNQAGVDSYNYSLPYDESVSPFDVSVNGNGTRNLMFGKIWGLSLEQRLPGEVYFQIDYNRERIRNPICDFLRGAASAMKADANLFLPDRVTPNPNFGRYYVEGEPRVLAFRNDSAETRVMLSHEFDPARRTNWIRWLGRHRAAAMYLRSEGCNQQQEFVQRIIPPGVSPATVLDNFGGATYNTFRFRAYLSDPTYPSTGNVFAVTMPFDPLRTTTYPLPDGSTYVAGYKNPYGATGSANLTNSLSESQVLALQSFFLQNRLVTSFGWRRDRIRQATYITQRQTAAPSSAFESIFTLDDPTNWSDYTKGDTNTQGAVLHVLPWVSVFYNQSSTWNPPTGLINPNDGTQVPGAVGKGKDYGIMLRALDNRISLRLNKYENTSGPTSNSNYRNGIVPVVQNIEETLIDRTADGTVNVPRPKFYDPEQGTYTLSEVTSDLVSEGYEAEIVANPTRNWRVSLSGAKSTAMASNIGRAWVDFIQERSSIWAANANLTGPAGNTTSIGTRYLAIIQILNQMKQADGQKVENGRDWRVNFLTRYAFSEGKLRGAFVGTGYRFRSPQVLGYLARMEKNEFELPGAPAEVLVPSRNAPLKGEIVSETELFLGYGRRLGKRMNWRVQLNIRNIFDNQDPVNQRANIGAGFVSVYTVPEPRSFILTNTVTF